MNENDFKELLNRPEINATGVAKKMFPKNEQTARNRLNQKVTNAKSGHSTQRLTEADLEKGWEVLKNLADTIYEKAPTKL